MYWFFHSVEFYVLLLFVAAAVLALCARPSRRGQALTHLVGGWLVQGEEEMPPALTVTVDDDSRVTIRRTGLHGVYATGSVALAITQIGFDLEIKERVVEGDILGAEQTEAVFVLTFLAQEWYHVHYSDERTGRMAAFSLHVRPGIETERPLVQ